MSLIKKIIIYPIKSLDGISITDVKISSGGTLSGDREFALLDENGKYLNGKKNEKLYHLRTSFDLQQRIVFFKNIIEDTSEYFNLDNERNRIEEWLQDYFSKKIKFIQNHSSGFPDDVDAYGPTIVSEGSLFEISKWFDGIPVNELERRFRPNIILDSQQAFLEDCLVGNEQKDFPFTIGNISFIGATICQRCVVPSKDPITGEKYDSFQKIFAEMRKTTLPEWSDKNRFDHFYRLCINTKIPFSEAGKILSVGDKLEFAENIS